MTWQLYKIPANTRCVWPTCRHPFDVTVKVWFVDDQATVPENMTADLGRFLVAEHPGVHPTALTPIVQSFVIDQPPDTWVPIGELPPEFEANPAVPALPDPRSDLWGMSDDQLRVAAAHYGVVEPDRKPGDQRWIKKNWVYAIHDARMVAASRPNVVSPGPVGVKAKDQLAAIDAAIAPYAVPNQEPGEPRLDMPVMPTTEPEKVTELAHERAVQEFGEVEVSSAISKVEQLYEGGFIDNETRIALIADIESR